MLAIHAQPGAKRTEVAGLLGDALRIRVAAAPIEDRANAALTAFLAERFGVPKKNVTLLSGRASREKRFAILGATLAPEAALLPV